MNNTDKPIAATRGEATLEIVAIALEAVPYVGGVLSSTASYYLNKRKDQRLNDFLINLAEDLQFVKDRINREFAKSEEFQNLTEDILSKAAEARQPEKLDALRAIFLIISNYYEAKMDTQIEVLQPLDLSRLPGFSAISETAALQRPLADVVRATLQAAGRSSHTQRAYQTAIGLFIQYLDQARGSSIPTDLASQWRPLAQSSKQTVHKESRTTTCTVWTFSGPTAVLRMVDAGLLDGFRVWREGVGDSPNAASLRVYAVRTFLSVAREELNLTEEELAFYDALEVNDSAVQVLGDQTLQTIARELVEMVRRNVSIDWTVKESVRAKLRTLVKRVLRKYGYPPDKQEKATLTVLAQAELLCADWAGGD